MQLWHLKIISVHSEKRYSHIFVNLPHKVNVSLMALIYQMYPSCEESIEDCSERRLGKLCVYHIQQDQKHFYLSGNWSSRPPSGVRCNISTHRQPATKHPCSTRYFAQSSVSKVKMPFRADRQDCRSCSIHSKSLSSKNCWQLVAASSLFLICFLFTLLKDKSAVELMENQDMLKTLTKVWELGKTVTFLLWQNHFFVLILSSIHF